MSQPYLSVIIPAYNEAKRLPLTLVDIDKHLSSSGFSYEIVVVDNNSTDGTREIVKRFLPLVQNLHLIECKKRGKGAAVKKGMLESRGKIRLFTDADNSTSITHFFPMKHYFLEGYDVVIGSRDLPGSKLEPPQSWYKRLLGNMGNLFIQLVALRGIWDTQCGFKAFSQTAVEKIFPLSRVFGWGFDVEVLALAKAFGFRIKEIPVTWVNSSFSHVKPFAYFAVLWEVVKIKFWLIGKYYGPISNKK